MDIIGKRKYTYTLSSILVILSIVMLIFSPLKFGIDFVGGTQLKVQKSESGIITKEALCEKLSEEFCAKSFIVRQADENGVLIEYKQSDESNNQAVIEAIAQVDPESTILQTDFIGSKISEQFRGNALTAIILAIVVILLFIAWAFRKISFPVSSWSYGFSAIVALIHDILIVLGLFALFGYLFDVEVGIPFTVALLTILGYSVNDTIVVYDRVRENILRTKDTAHFAQLVNKSLKETLARSLNTSLTVAVVLIAMIIWGSSSLLWFSVALLIGVIAGTYSSIFVATAIVVNIYEYKKKNKLL